MDIAIDLVNEIVRKPIGNVDGDPEIMREDPPRGNMRALLAVARESGLTMPGFLVRVVLRIPRLLPQLFRGKAPFAIRIQFLIVPAVRNTLRAHLGPDRADKAFRKFLFAVSAAAPLAAFGSRFPLTMTIPELAMKYREVFRGPGKHQKVEYMAQNDEMFRFRVLSCSFSKGLKDFGLESFTGSICDADRWYWINALRGTDIEWTKNEDTLGRGGPHCCSTFCHKDLRNIPMI